MHARTLQALMICAAAVVAPSCASRGRIQAVSPPAADLIQQPEPAYPLAALTDPAAEAEWGDAVLLWGRAGWAQVARLCAWAKKTGAGARVDC